MPLLKSASPKAIGPNIKREEAAGKPYKQALAIALHTQDTARQHRAGGGISLAQLPSPARQAQRDLSHDSFHAKGLFASDVAGRTDRIPRSVTADSFVFPADVVSTLGQGNTLAGAKIMDSIMGSGPYGVRLKRADGGAAPALSHVMVAGGEYLGHRDDLARIGARIRHAGKSKARTDIAAGHEWARGFVDKVRAHAKAFLRNAPKPKK